MTYLWNVALAESLHPSLQAAELSLRNALNNAISRRHRDRHPGSGHWLSHDEYFDKQQRNDLENSRREYANRRVTDPTPDQIVSSTNMGFWVALLSRKYERRLWHQIGFDLLKEVFPYAPDGLSAKQFYATFDEIRRLRNRANHYERICHRPDLLQLHDRIHERIGWINPDLRVIGENTDSFNLIHARGQEFYRAKIEQLMDGT